MSAAQQAAAFFDEPGRATTYADGPARFVPGYRDMQRMAALLLAESAGPDGEVLVLGAGGGLELAVFADEAPGWRFVGVDPSAAMLAQAAAVMAEAGAADRVRFVHGLIKDAPPGPFDAASCLLTLHFVPDDGGKLATLRAIRLRLKPGARFVVVDQCIDTAAPDALRRIDRYAGYATRSGADPALVAEFRTRITNLPMVGAARAAALLDEAGYTDTELFYAGLSWRGWTATA